MARRINSIGLCIIVVLCILLIFASNRISFPSFSSTPSNDYTIIKYRHYELLNNYNNLASSGSSENRRYYLNKKYYFNKISHRKKLYNTQIGSNTETDTTNSAYFNTSIRIEDVISTQRQRILNEMKDFEYQKQASNLKALVPELGGTPIQSVVLSTWRSGSTFLGDILNAIPGNYYHYEPLLNQEIIQIRGPPNSETALHTLKQLLTCNYTSLTDYLTFGQSHNNLFTHNNRLWHECHLYPQFCYDPNFLNQFCRLFPLQSMKVVRLRLALAEELITNKNLNVKLILLVRDPRATIQSRKHRVWCPGQPDCDNSAILCNDMISDYNAAIEFTKKYPDKFRAIRYEDLSLEPFKMTQQILEFLGLPFDPAVEEFLNSHTRADIGGVSSTFRDSKTAPFHWMRDLTFDEIEQIQLNCAKAMDLWGYMEADDEESLMTTIFNPLLKFPFS